MTKSTKISSEHMSRDSGMRILHLPGSYLHWVTGGKEIYTHSLVRELQQQGITNYVAFHQNESVMEPLGMHHVDGIQVHVLPMLTERSRKVWYANRTREIPGFAEILAKLKPDIVHMHDFGRNVNLHHLEIAKATGLKTIMTYHSPGQSCLQREMLFGGKTVCDGEIKTGRCTECRLAVQGIPTVIRKTLSRISLPLRCNGSKLTRALTARQMTAIFNSAWKELVAQIDSIHVQAHWIVDVMKINRVPEQKIAYFRSGLPMSRISTNVREPRKAGSPLKIIMLGRCEITKGQETLIDAVQQLPKDARIEISFFGPYWDSTEYGKRCLQKISGDTRFQQPRKIPHQDVPRELEKSDALAVPSLWLETGPLVVLEAFAFQIPVIGSNRGGISELVKHGKTGLLFTPGSSSELSSLLNHAIEKPQLLESMREHILKPRLMADTSADTIKLYESLLA